MSTTQQHLSIKDIYDDILLLKDGGGALVLQVSAVNFGLLSDREQIAIISSFAQMLNSLSFSIQIMIHSQRLNLNSYLELLDKAQKLQTNPLLALMINQYKQFISSTIKDNDVLDKKFYIVIPLFSTELGIMSSSETFKQKVKTIVMPRRDQIVRQLSRVGLSATQLTAPQLTKLFYEIYNGGEMERPIPQAVTKEQIAVELKTPQVPPAPAPSVPEPVRIPPQPQPPTSNLQPPTPSPASSLPPSQAGQSRSHPFVVEELGDV